MARIVFSSVGYLGSVGPFVGPANQLAARGHDVTFLLPEGFHQLLASEDFDLATYPLDCSPRGMYADPKHDRLMRHPFLNFSRLGLYWMNKGFGDDTVAARECMVDALKKADVAVCHPTFAGVVTPAAEYHDVPVVVGHLFPMLIPTEHRAPPLGQRSRDLGRTANRLSWRTFMAVTRRQGDPPVNEYRAALGLAPQQDCGLFAWRSAARVVMLASEHYFGAEPPDWPPVTWGGFSVWDGPAGGELDPAVQEYIDAGEPPVLVTLGTAPASRGAEQFRAIADGLDARGLRSLLLVGHDGAVRALEGRPGAFVFAPLTRVLPQCRVAVISGALGGLAAVLTRGVPVVVLPQLFDQLWHGRRVEELGVGLMVRKPADVAAAVARIAADPGYSVRARALADAMASEDGGAALVDAVEAVL